MRALSSLILMLSLLWLVPSGCSKQEEASEQAISQAKERLYAGYALDQPGSIDVGVQPLSMPESPVTELLARDNTLAAQLKARNLVLKPFPFYKGKEIYQLMLQGKLEAGVLGDMPALSAAASGDIVIAAMVKHGFSSIVGGKPMLVKDLKGKRIATGLGSTAHFTLLKALENEGLTEGDVEVVGMEVDDMPQALAQGRIDAFSAWEPTPTMALAAHPEFRLLHRGLNYGFLCFRRDFVTSHPAEARYIVAAVARGCLWMRQPGSLDQVAQWVKASSSRFQGTPSFLTPEQTVAITRNDLLNVPDAPQIPMRLLQERELLWTEFEYLKKNEKIPQKIPWEKVRNSFDTDLLQGVLTDSKPYDLRRFDYRYDHVQGGTK